MCLLDVCEGMWVCVRVYGFTCVGICSCVVRSWVLQECCLLDSYCPR